jgi:peptide chain release factor 1
MLGAGLIEPEDLKVETKALYERGGQHVGTQPVVVTVTHIPTGISASITQKSQHMARTIAVDMILAALTHPRFR